MPVAAACQKRNVGLRFQVMPPGWFPYLGWPVHGTPSLLATHGLYT